MITDRRKHAGGTPFGRGYRGHQGDPRWRRVFPPRPPRSQADWRKRHGGYRIGAITLYISGLVFVAAGVGIGLFQKTNPHAVATIQNYACPGRPSQGNCSARVRFETPSGFPVYTTVDMIGESEITRGRVVVYDNADDPTQVERRVEPALLMFLGSSGIFCWTFAVVSHRRRLEWSRRGMPADLPAEEPEVDPTEDPQMQAASNLGMVVAWFAFAITIVGVVLVWPETSGFSRVRFALAPLVVGYIAAQKTRQRFRIARMISKTT
jgi:hypothetical protein